MIAMLRRKITAAAICALLLIFAAVVASINVAYRQTLRSQISQSLQILTGDSAQSAPSQPRTRSGLPAVRASSLSRVTDYCVIRLDREGAVHEWKSENAEAYTNETVSALVNAIQSSGREEGFAGTQAYRMEARSYGSIIVAMDVSVEIAYARILLRITLIVGAAACALLSLLAFLLIRHTLLPVQEAVTKQQQFIWDASHELKTPLAAIAANAQALEKDLGGNVYFGYILSKIRSMNDLVQNLLVLARMDAGRQQVAFERFDLGAALLETALPMESLAFEMGKTLETNVSEGIFYHGNQALVQQLAGILLTNALQYSEPSGKVTLSLAAHGRRRMIRVHNTGSYIPPEERTKIFDRFYRADASHCRSDGGSGIGLAIAQSIAKLHRGALLVESDRQTGTAFTAILEDVS